jgi:hypothetical protein
VRGHLILRIAKASQGCVESVLRQRAASPARTRKDQCRFAGYGAQVIQYVDCLAGERNAVWASHLHANARNWPNRSVEINLRPLRTPQLAWPNEGEGEQLQPSAHFGHAMVALDRAQQFTESSWLDNGRAVTHGWRNQRPAQCSGWIIRCAPGGDGEAEY